MKASGWDFVPMSTIWGPPPPPPPPPGGPAPTFYYSYLPINLSLHRCTLERFHVWKIALHRPSAHSYLPPFPPTPLPYAMKLDAPGAQFWRCTERPGIQLRPRLDFDFSKSPERPRRSPEAAVQPSLSLQSGRTSVTEFVDLWGDSGARQERLVQIWLVTAGVCSDSRPRWVVTAEGEASEGPQCKKAAFELVALALSTSGEQFTVFLLYPKNQEVQ
jgi:hypothetical protein